MGPRPDGRGRFTSSSAHMWLIRRQWGRGRMAAEGDRGTRISCWMNQRQWGRGRMAAEGLLKAPRPPVVARVNGAAAGWPRKAVPLARVHWHARGVNGAAAGWPRKDLFRQCPKGLNTLRQWGRGRMAAEGWTDPSGCTMMRASMGPRPDGRGRPGLSSRRPCDHGVNGAAAGWPRKDFSTL